MLANRVTELLGIEIPIVQAPMGWIARSALASAVSNAGAMGIIETSSGELEAVRREIAMMKDLTDKPFGVNIAQAFVSDPEVIVDFVISQGVRFVTTSAGSPTRYTGALKDAGLTVFHVVPTVRAADKAVRAGVDGLVVEGGEGGGFKNPRPVSTMVLLPSVTSAFDLPVIAAGGFLDGRTMAAALALGAEGVQLGTAMVSSAESPVHANWKQAIVDADETGTVFLNSHTSPGLRALRTARSESLEFDHERNAMSAFGRVQDVYFGGDLGAGIALGGQVAGRISASRPVAEIVAACDVGVRSGPQPAGRGLPRALSIGRAVAAYERFAAFYDEVMDDPTPRAERVADAITRYRPGAATLLELGCGTGAILQRLTGVPTVVGLDRSPEMLAVAGAKVSAELVEGDLSSFSLGRTFDVIICVFDTLNHVLDFEDWRSAFDSVSDHLDTGGLFVFDINTIGELRRLGEDPPAVYDFGRGVAVVDVTFAQDGEESGLSEWDIRIFEAQGGCHYRLHRERIGELGVALARVRTEVEQRFDLLELTDERGRPATDDSVKAHFVLRRPPRGRRARPAARPAGEGRGRRVSS